MFCKIALVQIRFLSKYQLKDTTSGGGDNGSRSSCLLHDDGGSALVVPFYIVKNIPVPWEFNNLIQTLGKYQYISEYTSM